MERYEGSVTSSEHANDNLRPLLMRYNSELGQDMRFATVHLITKD